MKTYHQLLFTLILLATQTISAQSIFGLQIPKQNREEQCQRCLQAFRTKPKEVRFGIKREKLDLFLDISDPKWLNQFLKGPKDGIMLDIVAKDRYDCVKEEIEEGAYNIIGTPQKPIYTKAIKKGLRKLPNGTYRTKIGTVPGHMRNKELEFNIYFINNNFLCQYYRVYDLKTYRLELLDMGMYLDSLTYISDIKSPLQQEEGFTLKYKTLQFTVPFEKNKSEYSAADIKPVYDSLHLTDFDIKTIDIKAYSSVEGSLERNIELQEQRATSIVNALQEFQKPTIETSINATENWVEFLNDITGTKYANYSDLNKSEIKAKLTNASVNTALEPYLQKHRKALITLELQKKDKYKAMTSDQLFGLYTSAIADKNIDEALVLQNAIFERVKGNEISPGQINKLQVPKQKEFAQLANKNAALKYMIDEKEVLRTYTQLLAIDKLVPKNKKIKYNICATKFKIWRYRVEPIDTKEFKKEIQGLINYGVSQVLIDRMLINYHIIKSESFMRKGDFANKDKSMKYIYSQYKKIPLRDSDYLNLAQYFASYANFGYALDLLKNKVQSIDVDEDLLFYYLNLTLVDKEQTATSEYRSMMLNAVAKNQKRFCEIFNTFGKGGVTFQLLENPYLRKTYCENCN